MNRSALTVIVLATLFAVTATSTARADLTLGVMANRGELAATTEWTAFAKHLAEQIGTPVKLMTFGIERTFDVVRAKSVDLILTNPAQTAGLEEMFGVVPLASWRKNGETSFGGVIIANPKSRVTKTVDIKGMRVIAFNQESAGAYIFQRYQLLQAGIELPRDVASLQFTKKQDDIVLAVKAGIADVGFVRTGLIELMTAAGRIQPADLVIVEKVEDPSSPNVRSTPLYPDWFLSAAAGTDPALVARVKAAALGVAAGSPVAAAAKIDGFVEPLPRTELVKLLKAMKLSPFDR